MSEHGTALITGASAGIGRELARVFAAKGWNLVLVARNGEALESLAGELWREHGRTVFVLPRDLLAPGAPLELFTAVEKEGIAIDALVNNAGVMEVGPFDELEPEALERMVELNTRVPTALTRLFVPGMRERGRGRILNVASVAAFQPTPSMATYGATKAFLLSFSESLAEELAGTGVTVTALCPGLTATAMVDKARDASDRVAMLPNFLVSDVESVARAGYEACMAGRAIEVPGLGNAALTHLTRLPPRWVVRRVGGLVGRLMMGR